MAAVEIELNLPEGLAREAKAEGLLTPQSIESLLREEIQRRRVNHLFESANRMADYDAPALSEEEVEAEIQAARQERRAPHASRS
jgi:hypothetical protein